MEAMLLPSREERAVALPRTSLAEAATSFTPLAIGSIFLAVASAIATSFSSSFLSSASERADSVSAEAFSLAAS